MRRIDLNKANMTFPSGKNLTAESEPEIKPDQLQQLPGLLALARSVYETDTLQKWGRKLYRACLKRHYKHRYECSPRFHIETNNDGKQTVAWDGKIIQRMLPLNVLRQSGKGPAYIIASGPSLNEIDLNLLRRKVTISVNGSIAQFRKYGFSPSYSVIVDRDFFRNRLENVVEVLRSSTTCFFSSVGLSTLIERVPQEIVNADIRLLERIYQHYLLPSPTGEERMEWMLGQDWIFSDQSGGSRIGWSEDIEQGVFGGGTVVYAALQLASYMGFNPVYLVGVDMNTCGKQLRAYEEKDGKRPSGLDRDYEHLILPNFKLLRKYCIKSGLVVFNVSRTSRLPEDVLPRKSFEESLAS